MLWLYFFFIQSSNFSCEVQFVKAPKKKYMYIPNLSFVYIIIIIIIITTHL